MASLANDPGGRRRILFVDADGTRKTIRLGKMSKRQAEAVKLRVEDLVAAKLSGSTPSDETARWLATLDDTLRDKLAAVRLAERREAVLLGPFTNAYLEKRQGVVKASTLSVDRLAVGSLLGYFGCDRSLRTITAGDAEDFRNHLLTNKLAEGTVRKRCSIAGKMFRYAVRHGLMESNPFEQDPTNSVATEHFTFVSDSDAQKCWWSYLIASGDCCSL